MSKSLRSDQDKGQARKAELQCVYVFEKVYKTLNNRLGNLFANLYSVQLSKTSLEAFQEPQ